MIARTVDGLENEEWERRASKTGNKKSGRLSLAATPAATPSYPFRCNPVKCSMELFLQKNLCAAEKKFGRGGRRFWNEKPGRV
jgi:hypothetical protein